MFLKRIEIQGFKSFADKVVINFENSVTGIVGPNGCGKSNIADAIRWVLGEQSVKSLRGEKMVDVIFAGSENRRPLNKAEVTLVFDNSKHYLNADEEEIEITRRIYASEQDAEYLINRRQVRLKDIVDLILGSGLGKDSLSMISQGNISAFAEAKPYERRAIFEEAAGVAKYKKRKNEAINRLERTKDNLERTYDILNELEKQVSPLKRQARKAELYKEKKARLEEIEIAVLVKEIDLLSSQIEEVNRQLFDLESAVTMHKASIQVHENNVGFAKEELNALEKELNLSQDKLMKTLNEIRILETRKVEIDERRRYAIRTGDIDEKITHLKDLLHEAKSEYEDRVDRLAKLNAEIEINEHKLEECALALSEASFKKDETANLLRRFENRKELLENLLKDPFGANSQSGVRAIMENKEAFYGVMGVVGQNLFAKEGYEEALSVALGGSTYHIVTTNEESARKAIAFLKRNRSGRATFLPCSVLKRRKVNDQALFIAENSEGYIGVLSDFCDCEKEYEIIRDALLGNILVTKDLKSANELSALLEHNYRIVTLEGDVVNRGGSMTGGKSKNDLSLITASSQLEDIKKKLVSYEAEHELSIRKYNEIIKEKDQIDRNIMENRIAIATLEPVVDAKRAKYEKLQSDLETLAPQDQETNGDNTTISDDIVERLNREYAVRDELNTSLNALKDKRNHLKGDIERKEVQIKQIRNELEKAQDDANRYNAQGAVIKVKLDNDLQRLSSEYKMTYEYALANVNVDEDFENAKDEVNRLRDEIESLGNINMEAPEEYSKVNERYDLTKRSYDDLMSSRDKILNAIEEMDQIMVEQFKDTFDKINAELNNTFRALFGGGKAKLVLEDPNDILNTGIDVDVQPPGKSVKSIRLFSGGEKTLIAICVLFTILKIRPVPLIVFDEVEAALDQANVERFAKYVRSFEDDSQFIIITHRPGTMAQCDVLYGVTMQKRGVSQMLKVKLVDAIEMADKSEVEN